MKTLKFAQKGSLIVTLHCFWCGTDNIVDRITLSPPRICAKCGKDLLSTKSFERGTQVP